MSKEETNRNVIVQHGFDIGEIKRRLDQLETELETQKTVIQAIQNLLEPIKKKRG